MEELREDLSFTQRLAQYYSDFLATDFKKGSMPKGAFRHEIEGPPSWDNAGEILKFYACVE